ncbi:fasciclin domain-containing protein [Robiginitalea sp. IMCC43444]|uniref:fasciclin domain-containing protein n=1 Tax=Robiginitalea sp. IMCC43444 TaxID=3459121 RepID=UPI0040412459
MDLVQTASFQNTKQSATYRNLFNIAAATDIMEMLKDKGSFTVFAPSDEAFGRLNPSQIRELLKPENKKTLKSLLSYHIVAGELTASRILKAMCRGGGVARLTTIQGEELLASMQGTDIVLWDCSGNTARIINADSNRDNLIFHQIDSLVMPQAVSLP